VEIALTLAWRFAAVDSMPDDQGKLRDRLDSAVREAATYVTLDDLDLSYVKSGLLNAFMTAEWWQGRKFHTQETFMEPKTPVVFLTGNNLELTPDLSGRLLVCDLFSPDADPQSRKAPTRIIESAWLRQPVVHAQLVSALWAVVRAWRDGGRSHEGRVVAGFASWCRMYAGMVMHAGWPDPCAPRGGEDGYGNTEYQDMRELISFMAEGVEKEAEWPFIDIARACHERGCFPHMMEGKMEVKKDASSGEMVESFVPTAKCNDRLGKVLRAYGGKAFITKDGRRVVFDRRGKNRHRVYLVQVVGKIGE
jgi:hypothetical protein